MFFIIPGVCVFWTTLMGMPALGIGDVVDRDCKMYAVLNDMALTRPDPRHPFHVQAQIGRQQSVVFIEHTLYTIPCGRDNPCVSKCPEHFDNCWLWPSLRPG